jgi:hypothetical protein
MPKREHHGRPTRCTGHVLWFLYGANGLCRGTLTGVYDMAQCSIRQGGVMTGIFSAAEQNEKGSVVVADISWLALLAGLTLLTVAFARLCDAS